MSSAIQDSGLWARRDAHSPRSWTALALEERNGLGLGEEFEG
ncbi:hypothetical protein ACH437_15095 [Streptomyces xinghaiensis]